MLQISPQIQILAIETEGPPAPSVLARLGAFNFCLFGHLKKTLRGKAFDSLSEVEQHVRRVLNELNDDFSKKHSTILSSAGENASMRMVFT